MASYESMTVVSSIQGDEFNDIDVVEFDHDLDHQIHPHNLSRLSVCTSSIYTDEEEDDDHMDMEMYPSKLSMESLMESFDAEVDEEFSRKELSSDSDEEYSYCSLPISPVCWKNRIFGVEMIKDYASENDAHKFSSEKPKANRNLRRRRRRINRKGSCSSDKESKSSSGKKKEGDLVLGQSNYSGSFSGESEGSGAGLVVITRPKGGQRTLCMDLEEVKACRDLGFELEHERMLEMPSRVSLSGSTLDTTSSGGNSPIANWRISGPGDDPRDVKARLKVWAQAVAIASTSRCSS